MLWHLVDGARNAAKHSILQYTGQLPTVKNYSAYNANGAKTEKVWSRLLQNMKSDCRTSHTGSFMGSEKVLQRRSLCLSAQPRRPMFSPKLG